MARYIDKEIICEAYVHLNIDESISAAEIERIKVRLKSFFDERVEFLLGESVQTELETETGSLKVKLTAFGAVATLLGAGVMNYTDFRDNVRAMHEDAKMLAEATNLETIFVTRTPSCDRLHAEARTGIVGRLAKVVTQIETLSDTAANMHAPASIADVRRIGDLSNQIARLDADARKLLEKIKTDEDRFCVAKGLYLSFSKIPQVLPAENELNRDQLKSSILQGLDIYLLALSNFQSYTNTIKGIKSYLKKVGEASQTKEA